MKTRISFVCQQCSYQSPSYLGRCPNCGSWNSLVETIDEVRSAKSKVRSQRGRGKAAKPLRLPDIKVEHMARIASGMEELDRVLGGGLLKGAVILLSGDPGIGKSTILLHVSLHLAGLGKKVLYVSGEESVEQIKLRVDRLLKKENYLHLKNFFLLSETHVEDIIATLENLKPELVIIDSIQTMETGQLSGMAGSVGQIRESTSVLLQFAKSEQTPFFLVGHVTKEGTIAGPQVLSHMVDTVLFLEGERFQSLRILRGLKNRFGPVDEVGVFEMGESGFVEVKDPNRLFLSGESKVAGKAVILTLEGTRPLLCEIQALVVPTKLAFPKRVVSGLDSRRVELMIAVLQKILHLPLERFDIFVSTSSGLRISEPGLDLGICLAIASSFKNKPVKSGTLAVSEVTLLGELRVAPQMERRMKEAKRLGFGTVVSAPIYKTLTDVVKKVFA